MAFANIVCGVPLNAAHVYTGNLLTLLNPYGLPGGLVTLTLFTLHGAIFLSLKTAGDIRLRARTAALRLAPVVVLLAAGFLVVSQVSHGKPGTDLPAAVAAVARSWRPWRPPCAPGKAGPLRHRGHDRRRRGDPLRRPVADVCCPPVPRLPIA